VKVFRWLATLFALLFGRLLRRRSSDGEGSSDGRIVPEGSPERRAENWVLVLLGIAVLWAVGFVVAYAEFSPTGLPNELLGICLGACLLFIAAALTVVAKRLVVNEEIEEDYPSEHPEQQSEVAQIIHESGSKFTRKRLLIGAAGAAAGALGVAALAPAASLGPFWDTGPLDESPWRRGRRLVNVDDVPYRVADIEQDTFYTAFPEGADKEFIASSLVVVRLDPHAIHMPAGRESWTPEGIVAYSKICTHAGCAIALYRKPTFAAVQPGPALVCPCHYSTFNPANGGKVTYGPAGRPLPQLPLMADDLGYLRAAGNYSARVGPGWWNVLSPPTFVGKPT
jgi:ubiquinol-cytochrome c reductase iron-sulfur subunit